MSTQKVKKPEIPIQHFASDKPTFCVFEVYPKSNKTLYYFQEAKAKQLQSITLEGFQGIPPGLYLVGMWYEPQLTVC